MNALVGRTARRPSVVDAPCSPASPFTQQQQQGYRSALGLVLNPHGEGEATGWEGLGERNLPYLATRSIDRMTTDIPLPPTPRTAIDPSRRDRPTPRDHFTALPIPYPSSPSSYSSPRTPHLTPSSTSSTLSPQTPPSHASFLPASPSSPGGLAKQQQSFANIRLWKKKTASPNPSRRPSYASQEDGGGTSPGRGLIDMSSALKGIGARLFESPVQRRRGLSLSNEDGDFFAPPVTPVLRSPGLALRSPIPATNRPRPAALVLVDASPPRALGHRMVRTESTDSRLSFATISSFSDHQPPPSPTSHTRVSPSLSVDLDASTPSSSESAFPRQRQSSCESTASFASTLSNTESEIETAEIRTGTKETFTFGTLSFKEGAAVSRKPVDLLSFFDQHHGPDRPMSTTLQKSPSVSSFPQSVNCPPYELDDAFRFPGPSPYSGLLPPSQDDSGPRSRQPSATPSSILGAYYQPSLCTPVSSSSFTTHPDSDSEEYDLFARRGSSALNSPPSGYDEAERSAWVAFKASLSSPSPSRPRELSLDSGTSRRIWHDTDSEADEERRLKLYGFVGRRSSSTCWGSVKSEPASPTSTMGDRVEVAEGKDGGEGRLSMVETVRGQRNSVMSLKTMLKEGFF